MIFYKFKHIMNRLLSEVKFYETVDIKINAGILISIYLHTYTRMKYGNMYALIKIGKDLTQSRDVLKNQYLFTY